MNINELVNNTFATITDLQLYGTTTNQIEGIPTASYVQNMFNKLGEIQKNPLNLILRGLPHKLKILADSRTFYSMMNVSKLEMLKLYRQRFSQYKHSSEIQKTNILDLICKHNLYHQEQNLSADILSEETIVGSMILFYLAGVDTSSSTTRNSLTLLLDQVDVK